MTAESIFLVVSALRLTLPCAIAAAVLFLPWPRNAAVRCIFATMLAWAFSVFYAILVYNPAGIAYGHEQGMHFPEAAYDNNTVVSMLIGGWSFPVTTIAVVYFVRYLWHRSRNR